MCLSSHHSSYPSNHPASQANPAKILTNVHFRSAPHRSIHMSSSTPYRKTVRWRIVGSGVLPGKMIAKMRQVSTQTQAHSHTNAEHADRFPLLFGKMRWDDGARCGDDLVHKRDIAAAARRAYSHVLATAAANAAADAATPSVPANREYEVTACLCAIFTHTNTNRAFSERRVQCVFVCQSKRPTGCFPRPHADFSSAN